MLENENEFLSSWIINKLQREESPLVNGIEFVETDDLIVNLRTRLSLDSKVLDLSPGSLDVLENALKAYYHEKIQHISKASEDQIISIIKEIIAYFGRTVVENTDGQWVNRGTLKGTFIEVPGPISVTKGTKKKISEGTRLFLWNIATVLWDNYVMDFNSSDSLYKEFLIAKDKKMSGF